MKLGGVDTRPTPTRVVDIRALRKKVRAMDAELADELRCERSDKFLSRRTSGIDPVPTCLDLILAKVDRRPAAFRPAPKDPDAKPEEPCDACVVLWHSKMVRKALAKIGGGEA